MSKITPPADFDDNPEWTDEHFARARPSGEVQPPHVAKALVRKRGRPVGSTSSTKEQIALRVDADVLAAYKSDGPGWQTRMNDALRKAVAEKSLSSG